MVLSAREGTLGSEDLARALDEAGRLDRCVWLRLVAADRDIDVLAHSLSHALGRVDPGAGGRLADEFAHRSRRGAAPDELAQALAGVLPDDSVVVLEDGRNVAITRRFAQFCAAWSRVAASGRLLVVITHGRPARRIRALALPAPRDRYESSVAAGEHAAALSAPLAERLVQIAAGHPALVKDVADAASAKRGDLVAEIVATARGPHDLVTRLTDQLLARAGQDELDALGAASRLGYWHPDLGSPVLTARLRPWLLPLQSDWHWLRPIWDGPLAARLRLVGRRPTRWWNLGRRVGCPPMTSDAGHDFWPGSSDLDRLATVTVRMLGSFELAINGRPVTTWHGHLGPSVLKYLLAQPKQASPRDVLLDVFWPSVPAELARNRLQVALSGVRRTLEAVTEAQLIEYRDGNYVVGRGVEVERDIDTFEQRIESGRQDEIDGETERSIKHLKEAAALYRGDLLEDSPYEEWTVLPREALRFKYLDLLDRLARLLLKHDRIGECIDVAQHILHQDMCREDAHRLLMRCYARQGHTHHALRQFDLCRQSLRETMDVDPAPATLALYRSLRGRVRS